MQKEIVMHPTIHTYFASENRVGVDFTLLDIGLPDTQAIRLIEEAGLRQIDVPPIAQLARDRIGKSRYVKRNLSLNEAPLRVHCATFVGWLYAQFGIFLPNRCLFQSLFGLPVNQGEEQEGDLIFIEGRHGLYLSDPNMKIGHVGMMTESGTVIHAANSRRNIVEESFDDFIHPEKSPVIVRRITPSFDRLAVFAIPDSIPIHMMLDAWRLIVRSLPKSIQ